MKTIFNKRTIMILPVLVLVLLGSLSCVSCTKDDLETQNNFPFEVSVMPVPKQITNGETIEIRLAIERAEQYNDTKYFIRYFQNDGRGFLLLQNRRVLAPNDLYPLAPGPFRLYYTSGSNVSQSFTIWISDNFGNEKQLTFEFNSAN